MRTLAADLTDGSADLIRVAAAANVKNVILGMYSKYNIPEAIYCPVNIVKEFL